MKKQLWFLLACLMAYGPSQAQDVRVESPGRQLIVSLTCTPEGSLRYEVTCHGKTMLRPSPLGLRTDIGDFTRGLAPAGERRAAIDTTYALTRSKASRVHYRANELTCTFCNADGRHFSVQFRVSDRDVAFRYLLPHEKGTGCVRVEQELTGFAFPPQTTTFLCPQSLPMTGWKRSKPSYEEEYEPDAPSGKPSRHGEGFTFPCLFRIGDDGWVLVSETGVDSRYCASHLGDARDGTYPIAFPMPAENNGNGTVAPAFALPGATPWRTITAGPTPAPVVETTVPWDVVAPRYAPTRTYRPGRSTWSWIVWQDASCNYDDQLLFIDLAERMGYEYILIDAGWDKNIGYRRMEQLIRHARSRGVDVFLWYSSSGCWNDIVQSPTNRMDNAIVRKREMRWLREQGVKGIKVDFFGGDKQETMRLYEDILSDADDHGLMVIFHGCTLPRGWERMYPNYMGSEAVLASENLVFDQHFCDREAENACLHPFIRNTVGSMEFGGCFLNRRLNRGNDGGTTRRTTDAFQLATTVLFQNPVQNIAITPGNLSDAPRACIDFLKDVPVTWDETRFVDGYPGRYVVLARRHGRQWYVTAVNGTARPLDLRVELPMAAGQEVTRHADRDGSVVKERIRLKDSGKYTFRLLPRGGEVLVSAPEGKSSLPEPCR